jgi:3-hydroxy-3-methylglutaryl CoA synthase
MIGITSIGFHIPIYRLPRSVIAGAWQTRSLGGEKAIAGHDEDSLTMAINAAHDCVSRFVPNAETSAVFFVSTSSPYKEKQAGATLASTLNLPPNTYTADIAGSMRGATIAMNLAIGMVKGNLAGQAVISASDCRLGLPQSDLEQRLGDAAACISIGDRDPVAEITASYSVFDEFLDFWRMEQDTFVKSWEERFVLSEGYMRVVGKAVSEFLKRSNMLAKDFSKVILCGPDARSQAGIAKSLGFNEKSQVQEPLFSTIGQAGSAEPLIMLGSALEKAKGGDKILFAAYGDGCDIFALEVRDSIKRVQEGNRLEKQLSRKTSVGYEKYLSWRNLLSVGFPRRPDPEMRSITRRWREQKRILALYGAKCKKCGTVQYPPQRVCVQCRSKDDFDDYKLTGRTAKVFTFATDGLTPSKAPPVVNAFLEFDGGGRMICNLTDCDPAHVKIGMPVEMTFRKLNQFPDMYDYFWKARPIEV